MNERIWHRRSEEIIAMGDRPIHLGEYGGSLIWAFFELGKGYTANSCVAGPIGPLPTKAKAKQAICDLLQANTLYLARNQGAKVIDDKTRELIPYFKKYTTFKESPECKEVFDKYKLPLPQ